MKLIIVTFVQKRKTVHRRRKGSAWTPKWTLSSFLTGTGTRRYRGIYFRRDIYYAKCWGKNKKLRVGGKNEKGDRKTEENCIKNGEKGLKILFGLYNPKWMGMNGMHNIYPWFFVKINSRVLIFSFYFYKWCNLWHLIVPSLEMIKTFIFSLTIPLKHQDDKYLCYPLPLSHYYSIPN